MKAGASGDAHQLVSPVSMPALALDPRRRLPCLRPASIACFMVMSNSFDGAHVAEAFVEVRSYELDSFGHVNHAVFLNYLEYARFEALRQGGFPYDDLVARGWGVYVVRIEVDYLKEARLGDQLLIRTWASSSKRSSMVLAQEIRRREAPAEILARARVTAVWVGPDRRPIRVPDEVRAALGMRTASGDGAP